MMRDLNEINVNEGGVPVSRPAPTAQDIKQFETAYGLSLPESYLQFLRHANGGHPELNCFLPLGASADNRWSIDVFYHLGPDQEEPNNIWLMTQRWRSVLGESVVPIAQDGGGNQVYLDFRGDAPMVKLCVHDEEFKTISVADSFDSFVDMLHEDPDMI
jgi:hypothetical protein